MRKLAFIFFSIISIIVFFFYLVSCFTPYISPAFFWPMSFLGLAFPLLALMALCCSISWLFLRRKIAVVFFVLFSAGYKNLNATFAFRRPVEFQVQKDSATLRILDWNVLGFSDNSIKLKNRSSKRSEMFDYIRTVNADVIFMQEFLEITDPRSFSNIKMLKDSLGYRYFYLSNDKVIAKPNRSTAYGCAIFSRLPLSKTSQHPFNEPDSFESLLCAEISFRGKKVKLATTHLRSLNLGEAPSGSEIFDGKETGFILGSSQVQKIKHYDSIHGREAEFIRNILAKSSSPLIIAGDFNSVPSSYAYHTIKGDLQDAFVRKGSGIGRSFTRVFPTLRIDYILADKQFQVLQYASPRLFLSDHFPVVTDLQWR